MKKRVQIKPDGDCFLKQVLIRLESKGLFHCHYKIFENIICDIKASTHCFFSYFTKIMSLKNSEKCFSFQLKKSILTEKKNIFHNFLRALFSFETLKFSWFSYFLFNILCFTEVKNGIIMTLCILNKLPVVIFVIT